MDKTLVKFLTFLEEYRKETIQNLKKRLEKPNLISIQSEVEKVENKLIIILNFMELLSVPKNQWEQYCVLCKDFDVLSEYLLKSNLNYRERMYVLFLLVEKNICGKILDNLAIIVDFSELRNHKFKTLRNEDLDDEEAIYYFLLNKEDSRLDWSEEQKDEFLSYAKKNVIDIRDIQRSHQKILDSYFKKQNTYNEEDIKIICQSFAELGVFEELIENTKNILTNDMNSRLKKQQANFIKINDQTLYKRNEYQNISKYLEQFVDLKEMLPKENLNHEQMLNCVTLMLRLKISREDINIFLRNYEINRSCMKIDPITLYLEEYQKIKYYEDKLILFEQVKAMEDIFQMLWITDSEEYTFWKNCFQEELNSCLKAIPGGFAYEFEESHKRLEKTKKL